MDYSIMHIEVSTGEILDKLSILEIKRNKITDINKLYNITKEYEYLIELSDVLLQNTDIKILFDKLKHTNSILWDVEDAIRQKEKFQSFDHEFINLARRVYIYNDERAELKKQINKLTQSNFMEEKSYEQY